MGLADRVAATMSATVSSSFIAMRAERLSNELAGGPDPDCRPDLRIHVDQPR